LLLSAWQKVKIQLGDPFNHLPRVKEDAVRPKRRWWNFPRKKNGGSI